VSKNRGAPRAVLVHDLPSSRIDAAQSGQKSHTTQLAKNASQSGGEPAPSYLRTLANAGAEDVRLLVEFRPALRSENLFETFFGVGPGRSTARRLRDLVRLLVATRGYRDEIRIAWRSLV
jgi:hypothetical protein